MGPSQGWKQGPHPLSWALLATGLQCEKVRNLPTWAISGTWFPMESPPTFPRILACGGPHGFGHIPACVTEHDNWLHMSRQGPNLRKRPVGRIEPWSQLVRRLEI